MAFLNNSIEDSLKLINKNATKQIKRRGRPRKVPPKMSPVREKSPKRFSPFRTEGRPSSPISLQRSPEINERPLRPSTPEALNRDDSPVIEEDVPESKSTFIELGSKYFNVCRYIQVEENLLYAIAYDINGQVVYIELDEIAHTTSTGAHGVSQMVNKDLLDFPFSVKEYFKTKISHSVYGIVMTRGDNMCFLKKTDDGSIEETFIGRDGENVHPETTRISFYSVFKYSDIMEDIGESILGISETYEMIQQFQIISNKDIFSSTMNDIGKLYAYSLELDKVYRSLTEIILDDWGRFSNVSADYCEKMLDEGLTEEEDQKLRHISLNLFARFTSFNDTFSTIGGMHSITTPLIEIINNLKDSIDLFTKESRRLKGKILDPVEVDILL
jgi:hypothetical protein